ncbi:hypothetical protein I317_04096 [Kwoniella heveanensis CBS 569]|nr:hypothetical protein I317_04096 [Kwoniella heveanensis CBS 569]
MSGPPQQEAALPITNTLFPPPPPYFQAYTQANLDRYEELTGRPLLSSGKGKEKATVDNAQFDNHDDTVHRDTEAGSSESEEGKALREKLEKPRADWIEEDGRWMCFGQMYTTEPIIPTADSIGLPPLLDPALPPQESLPPLLHSFLHTLLLLLDALTNSARTPDELFHAGWAHEGDQYIQHLTNLSANMMVASNQLRGVQSEATLVMMMEKELEERKKQTEVLRR